MGRWSWQFERLFFMGREGNIPTWFSSLLWACAALAAYGCSSLTPWRHEHWVWVGTALVLIGLSCDETAMIHEHFSGVLSRHVYHKSFAARFPVTVWPITLGPFIALGLLWLVLNLRRCLRESTNAARWLSGGAILVLVGAMGLEMTTNVLTGDSLKGLRFVEILLEESLEMLGAIAIIAGLLVHWQVLRQRVEEREAA